MSALPSTSRTGLTRWTNLFSLLVIGIGISAIAGWIFDVSLLKRIVPGSIAMKFNAALLFLLAGLSLRGASICRSPRCQRMSKFFSGVVILAGSLTLFEHLSGQDLGIDNLFIAENAPASKKYVPGRMSTQTAVCFVFFGVALLLSLAGQIGWRRTLSRALRICLTFIALANLSGHFFGFVFRVRSSQITGMAVHTALAFLLLGAGLWCAMHESSPRKTLLFSETTGGIMARRLLPAAIFLPVFLGWLVRSDLRPVLYDSSSGVAFIVVCAMFFFTTLILATARQLHRMDVARCEAVEARDHTIAELQHALDEVRTLQGLLPMCAWCKKIRDDQGYWDDVSSYIARHTGASVSHGICPDCASTHFPAATQPLPDNQ
ncbi:hypothetical protein [Prosthecobacter sp.]|uniref:hypothetical protein n=1 Tax=Prosthecobacter sp. TaxID=1965333 RepID=UPI003783437F